MRKSDVQRRAEIAATVKVINTALASRFGRRYEAVLLTSPRKLDRVMIQRYASGNEEEGVGLEKAPATPA